MTPKLPSLHTRIAILASLKSNLAAFEAEYRAYRRAADRYHARADKRLEAIRDALSKIDKWADTDSDGARKPGDSRKADGKPLSKRELQILKLIAEGNGTKQAAAALGIAFKTAVGHRSKLMEKLAIHDAASLTRYAIRTGIIDP